MKKRIAALVIAAAMAITALPLLKGAKQIKAHAAADYGSTRLADYAYQVAQLVNKERQANGLSPLKYSDKLSEAALVRATEIQKSFSHTRPDGRSCFTAMTELGISYTYAGENIAYGQKTPESVMTSWMNSSGHRANILNTKVSYIGVGVTYKNGVYYWTQFFAQSGSLTGEVPADGTTTTKVTTKAPATTTTAKVTTKVPTTTTKKVTTKAPATTTKKVTTKAPATTTKKVTAKAPATTTKRVTTMPKRTVTCTVTAAPPVQSGGAVCSNSRVAELLKIINNRLSLSSNGALGCK